MIYVTNQGTLDLTQDYDYIVSTISLDDMPSKRFTKEQVIGKDGEFIFSDGFNNKNVSVRLINKSNTSLTIRRNNARDIKKILQYDGLLTFGYETDKYYNAKLLSGGSVRFNSNYDELVLTFELSPFQLTDIEGSLTWEEANIAWGSANFTWALTELENSFAAGTHTITNRGNTDSKPLYVMSGAGTVTVGTKSFTVTEACTVDVDNLIVYNGTTNKTSSFTGDFIELAAGDNTITTDVAITVENKDRWI